MIRKSLYAILSLTLVLSSFVFSLASSAYSAELINTPLHNGIYDPAGVSGTVRYTVPFGGETREQATPYLGLSLNATKTFDGTAGFNDKYSVTRSLADVRFTSDGLRTAQFGGVTMMDNGNASGDVLGGGTILWVLIVAAVAVGAYLVIDNGHKNNSTAQ
jgi:hypothetical protein